MGFFMYEQNDLEFLNWIKSANHIRDHEKLEMYYDYYYCNRIIEDPKPSRDDFITTLPENYVTVEEATPFNRPSLKVYRDIAYNVLNEERYQQELSNYNCTSRKDKDIESIVMEHDRYEQLYGSFGGYSTLRVWINRPDRKLAKYNIDIDIDRGIFICEWFAEDPNLKRKMTWSMKKFKAAVDVLESIYKENQVLGILSND